MTRIEAFERLLESPPRGFAAMLGKNRAYVASLRRDFKQGKVSEQLMAEVLTAAGWEKKSEERWEYVKKALKK